MTAPPLGQKIDRFRIALASCSHYEQGFYAAYREMAEDAPDVILHVGDYIYESSWGDPVRRHEGAEPMTIDEYRARYALYRTDPDLQAAHARAPWLYTWDDHEVDNDYAADQAEDGMDPALFVQRRARPIAPASTTCPCVVRRCCAALRCVSFSATSSAISSI